MAPNINPFSSHKISSASRNPFHQQEISIGLDFILSGYKICTCSCLNIQLQFFWLLKSFLLYMHSVHCAIVHCMPCPFKSCLFVCSTHTTLFSLNANSSGSSPFPYHDRSFLLYAQFVVDRLSWLRTLINVDLCGRQRSQEERIQP